MDRAVRTPDGRTLAVEDAGDPADRVVLVHGALPTRVTCMASTWPMRLRGACGSLATTDPGTEARHPTRDTASSTARVTSERSAPRWRSTGWRCGAFPAAALTCWPARRCFPILLWLRRRSPRPHRRSRHQNEQQAEQQRHRTASDADRKAEGGLPVTDGGPTGPNSLTSLEHAP